MVALWVGASLTIYGMGLVFLLLALLWGLIALLTRLDRRGQGAEAAADLDVAAMAGSDADVATIPDAVGLEPDVLAAVVVACRAHRMARRRQAAPEMRTHQPGTLPSRWVGTGRTRQNRSWAPGGRFA